jgi:hypothetical protein
MTVCVVLTEAEFCAPAREIVPVVFRACTALAPVA